MTETEPTRRDGETKKKDLLQRIPTRLHSQEEATRVLLEEELVLRPNPNLKPSPDLLQVTKQVEHQDQVTVVHSSSSSRRVLSLRCHTLKAR